MTDQSKEFDLIIIGGGTAGCVIAGRLTQAFPNLSIALLEAGPHPDEAVSRPLQGMFSALMGAPTARIFNADKDKSLNGRSLPVASGNTLGGGSAINFMIYNQAPASDWNDWNQPGWSYEEIQPYIHKVHPYTMPAAKRHLWEYFACLPFNPAENEQFLRAVAIFGESSWEPDPELKFPAWPSGVPGDELEDDAYRWMWDELEQMITSVLFAAGKVLGFDLYEAYAVRMSGGVYREGLPESWKSATGDPKAIASSICIPEDVLTLVGKALFGLMTSPAVTAFLRTLGRLHRENFLSKRVGEWVKSAEAREKACNEADAAKRGKDVRHWTKAARNINPLGELPPALLEHRRTYYEALAEQQIRQLPPESDSEPEAEEMPVLDDIAEGSLIHRQPSNSLPTVGKQMGTWQFEGFTRDQLYQWVGLNPRKSWPRLKEKWAGTLNDIVPRLLQVVGVVEALSRAYGGGFYVDSSKKHSKRLYQRGVIFADETSVGKTLQAVMLLGLLSHFAEEYKDVSINKDRKKLPRAMRSGRAEWRRYKATTTAAKIAEYQKVGQQFGSYDLFAFTNERAPPMLPSIVVAPSMLIPMWVSYFASCSTFRIHIVRNKDSIGAIMTVLAKMKRASDDILLIGNSMLSSLDSDSPLFGIDFLCCIVDEVHFAKSVNSLHAAVKRLCQKSAFTVGQTATPIVNTALDVCYIASALDLPEAKGIGIAGAAKPHFFVEVQRSTSAALRKNRGNVLVGSDAWYTVAEQRDMADEEAAATAAAGALQALGATATVSAVPSDRKAIARAAGKLGIKGVDDVNEDNQKAIDSTLALFAHYLIRRTKTGKDGSGEKLVPLGTLSQSVVYVQLDTPEVTDMREYLADEEHRRVAAGAKPSTDRLTYYGPIYSAARPATLHPFYYRFKRLPAKRDKYYNCVPPKIQAAIDLIKIIIEAEKELDITKRDKFAVFVDSLEVLPALVYEFARQNLFLRTLSGLTSAKDRTRILNDINRDEDHNADDYPNQPRRKTRILVCLPVTNVGINLWRCCVMINLTYPWSQFTFIQMIGRVHRTPTKPDRTPPPVQVYSLVATNSVDVVFLTASLVKGVLDVNTKHVNKGRGTDWQSGLADLLRVDTTQEKTVRPAPLIPKTRQVKLATEWDLRPPMKGGNQTVDQREANRALGVEEVFDNLYIKRYAWEKSTSKRTRNSAVASAAHSTGTDIAPTFAVKPSRSKEWKEHLARSLVTGCKHEGFTAPAVITDVKLADMEGWDYEELLMNMKDEVLSARDRKLSSIIEALVIIRDDILKDPWEPEYVMGRMGRIKKNHGKLVLNNEIDNTFSLPDYHDWPLLSKWAKDTLNSGITHLPAETSATLPEWAIAGHLHRVAPEVTKQPDVSVAAAGIAAGEVRLDKGKGKQVETEVPVDRGKKRAAEETWQEQQDRAFADAIASAAHQSAFDSYGWAKPGESSRRARM